MADLKVPALGESISEAVIGRWLKNVGEYVEADEPVVDLETDKITVQLPAPVSGALSEQRFSEGDTVKVGDVVGLIDSAAKATAKAEPVAKAEASPKPAESRKAESGAGATADAKDDDAEQVPERDASGRVLSPAMRRAAREGNFSATVMPDAPVRAPADAKAPAPSSKSKAPSPSSGAREEVVKMSPLRKRIAERLVQAQHGSASLTTFNEIDMSRMLALRSKHKEDFLEAHGTKLGFMSFFVKATVAALKKYPGVNAEVRDEHIVYKKHYDLGIAVGTEKGLVVPVLRDCDLMSFAEIEQGIVDLATKARKGGLTLDDLTGGTFTLTNGGIYGSMMSTPLLNYPQTGILGMHNIVKRPWVVGDAVEVRPMMYIALTYDHRVVDGKEAVQFLVAIKERIEEPERLMFAT